MATALLTWDASGGALSYKVEFKLASDSVWTLFGSNITTTSCQISGLSYATTYDFRVTAQCSTGNASPIIKTATIPCPSSNVSDIFLIQDSTANNTTPDSTIAANRRHPSYGQFGTRIYQINGFDSHGAATLPTTDITSASYFMNNITGLESNGRLNNVGIWGADQCANPTWQALGNQFIGFVRVFTIPIDGVYYIGCGADNWIRILVDNHPFVENNVTTVVNFKWWHIYPVQLTAGTHTIGIYGWDDGSISASFGGEIYNDSPDRIISATSINDLHLIYSTSWEFCNVFDAGQTIGYSCPDGWQLDTSSNPPQCIKANIVCN